jgi:hypothetical protein
MSARNRVRRLSRSVRELPAAAPEPPPPEADGSQLAREAVAAFAEELKLYRRERGPAGNRANPAEPPDDWEVNSILSVPPEDFTFAHFERLSKADPAKAVARWAEVMAAARKDLDSGWLAGRALESVGGNAWERACFLAIRQRLRESWPPRNAGEAILIDELAQYELMRRQWVSVLSMVTRKPQTIITLLERRDRNETPRTQTAAEATAEAARMVERLQRMYQRTLRTLLGLRRTGSAFIVQRSGQVNVAVGPQVNVATTGADDLEPEVAVVDTGEESQGGRAERREPPDREDVGRLS